jgi:hypothetical protein
VGVRYLVSFIEYIISFCRIGFGFDMATFSSFVIAAERPSNSAAVEVENVQKKLAVLSRVLFVYVLQQL